MNNNKIKSIGIMIKNLKQLPKLQVLNASGNPYTKDYVDYIVHHLKDLKYVDSRFIDANMLQAAQNEDKYKLEELDAIGEDMKKTKDDVNVAEFEELNLMIICKYDDQLLSKDSKDLEIITKNETRVFEMSRNTFRETVRQTCATVLGLLRSQFLVRK